MTNTVIAQDITTDAVACECGDLECFFCEPFAGMTDEQAWELFNACPKCDALPSEEHDVDCRYGAAARRFAGECEINGTDCSGNAEWREDPYESDVNENPGVMMFACPACYQDRVDAI
jgi:hypothetical protein